MNERGRSLGEIVVAQTMALTALGYRLTRLRREMGTSFIQDEALEGMLLLAEETLVATGAAREQTRREAVMDD